MFQLGGPNSLEAVEPFLLNLFLDPDIIPLGPFGLLRRPIAKLISSRRSIPVAGRYAQIGRRSPIKQSGDSLRRPTGTYGQQFSQPSAVYSGAGTTHRIRIAAIPGQFAHSLSVQRARPADELGRKGRSLSETD